MITPLIIAALVVAAILFIGIRKHMLKQMVIMLLLVAAVVGVIGYFKYQGFQGFMAMKEGMAHMKQTVSSAKATTEDWSSEMSAVGSLRAVKGVDIANELAGSVDEIHFNSGGDIEEGTLLIKLRSDDDVAKLQSLEASAKLAEITYNRDKKQLSVQAVAQATVDIDAANLSSARALAAQQKALVDKKNIHAPFSGHLGIRNVDVGQYLQPGTPIVTLQQLDPIYLDFTLPQQALSKLKPGQKIAIKNDTYPDQKFEGTISAINPKVDLATRNVQIRAQLPNAEHLLLPGMYATAMITIGEPQRFVTVPQTAISYNPYGNTVYVVKTPAQAKEEEAKKQAEGKKDEASQDKKAAEAKQDAAPVDDKKDDLVVVQEFVTLGETRGDQVQILKGVSEGDEIVTSGQLKLQNGAAVTINNDVIPKNDSAPQPKDK